MDVSKSKSILGLIAAIYRGHPVAFFIVLFFALTGVYLDRHPQFMVTLIAAVSESMATLLLMLLLIAEDRCKDAAARRAQASEIMHWIDTQLACRPVPPRDHFGAPPSGPQRFYERPK